MPKPIVVIIGRPNVGKSSLFNRVLGRRLAIVDDSPGITRDRNYALVNWEGIEFYLVDTGGLLPEFNEKMIKLVRTQVYFAINEADLILFVVDGKEGVNPWDKKIADVLRKVALEKVIMVVNKVDTEKDESIVGEFHNLRLNTEIVFVSAQHGREIGELLSKIRIRLNISTNNDIVELDGIKIAVIGRPNVGKSSLINAILEKERLIVDEIPGTTRDSIDTLFHYQGKDYVFIDTAGLRRHSKIKYGIEYFMTLRSIRSVDRCDVCLVILSAQEGIFSEDIRIARLPFERFKGIILVVNKWDILSGITSQRKVQEKIYKSCPHLRYVPVIFTSVKTKYGLEKLLKQIDIVYDSTKRILDNRFLDDLLLNAVTHFPPPAVGGKFIKIQNCRQTSVSPQTIEITCNYPGLIPFSYMRYLENQIQNGLGLPGIRILLKIVKIRDSEEVGVR